MNTHVFPTTTTEAPGDDELLTVREVAVQLRCSRPHAYNLLNGTVRGTPTLPHIKVGRRKLVRKSAFRKWQQLVESHFIEATEDEHAIVSGESERTP